MAASSGGGIRQLITLVGDQQVKAAFNSMGASGEAAFKRLQTAASDASASLTDVGRHTDTRVTGLTRLAGELTQTTQKMQIFGEFVGSVKAGLLGLVAFEAGRTIFSTIKQGISDSIKGFNDLRDTSSNFNLDPDTVKAWGQAMKGANLQSSDASASLGGFAQRLADAQKDVQSFNSAWAPTVGVLKGAEGAISATASGMTLLRGGASGAIDALKGVVDVSRGGVQQTNAAADAWETLGIKLKDPSLPKGPKALDIVIDALARKVAALGEKAKIAPNLDALREIAQTDFNIKNLDDFKKLLLEINQIGFEKFRASAAGLPPTKQDRDNLGEYNKALAELQNRFRGGNDEAAAFSLTMDTALLKGAERSLHAIQSLALGIANLFKNSGIGSDASTAFDTIKTALSNAISSLPQVTADGLATLKSALAAFGQTDEGTIWTGLTAGWQAALDIMTKALTAFLQGATSAMTSFTEGLTSLFAQAWANITDGLNQLWEKVKSLGSSISDLFSSAGTASGAPGGNLEGFAGGGFVSGPGTATSDSILARLSAGEFVVRAAAVDRVGVPLLQALNGLRTPIVPRTRFATGGLVAAAPSGSAGSGSAVVLVLHNTPHSLTTDSATRDSLLRLGRKSGMVSAGRIPGIA